MFRFHAPFDGRRFIGDNRLKIFHDCLNEPAPSRLKGCGIDRIPPEEVRIFDPDSSSEAWRHGFVQCPCCRPAAKPIHE